MYCCLYFILLYCLCCSNLYEKISSFSCLMYLKNFVFQLLVKFRESLKSLTPNRFLLIEKYTKSKKITDDSVSVHIYRYNVHLHLELSPTINL